ncbi:GNAT family N-acetyltransferase [Yersinia ruckeri]|nr:Acetyltransferase [Yersinia ruckeri ATCC 29473]OEU25260.1 GNAT family N-acetyltransferase [Yersinia ruckeri]OIX31098.1 GNAT family N-acetyltransferase [Yersinia ruckeri]OIX31237.1 GNAT family N-acetyltransferase [Yersinia ruckeri]OIX40510.1 GNAT family N-acetyltransferase [Yersinia ruckeri]
MMKNVVKSTDKAFSVHLATPAEWQSAVEMARNEHWDLGHGDDRIFLNVDKNGFFIGRTEGRIVASISIVNFDPGYAHLGHYIVTPEYRGKGLGLELWTAAIEHAGERCIGLDGMPMQEENYKKWGFRTHYHTYRIQGRASGIAIKADNISEVSSHHLSAIADFDTSFSGCNRASLLSSWFTADNRQGFVVTEGASVKGVIALRPSDEGYRIGPFYAPDENHAIALLQTALGALPKNALVTLDVPEQAGATLDVLKVAGFSPLFHTCRMYRGTPPVSYQKGNNAVASLELG